MCLLNVVRPPNFMYTELDVTKEQIVYCLRFKAVKLAFTETAEYRDCLSMTYSGEGVIQSAWFLMCISVY